MLYEVITCLGVQEMRYHNEIVIGLAPGGDVKVWGTGGCGDKDRNNFV